VTTWQTGDRQNFFLNLLNFSILNSFTLLASCASILSHRNFGHDMLRDLTEEGGRLPQPQTTQWGRPTTSNFHQPTEMA